MSGELKDLVWLETGFVLNKDEIFEDEFDAMFYKTLNEKVYGIEKRSVWFQKYHPERFFDTEREALEECGDYSEIEKEQELIGKRLRKLDEIEKETKK